MKRLATWLALGFLFSCGGPEIPEKEANCTDQADEDQDGDTDCDDSDCVDAPECQPTLEFCDNGIDDDLDNDADCDDADCAFAQNCQATPELCTLGSGDEDGDALADCQDPDCAADPICGPEICNDDIDNNGNFVIDCAEASCAQAANCQGPQPEQCADGADNDQDGDIDCVDLDCFTAPECAGAVCDPDNDQCGGNSICIVNICESAFNRSYHFAGFVLHLGPKDRNGGTWDSNSNPPDPKVELHLNGNKILETANKSNTFDATYSESVNRTIQSGDVLEVRVLDVDSNADDLALSCFANPLSAALLRARALSCQNTVGGNNIGTVTFSITPN